MSRCLCLSLTAAFLVAAGPARHEEPLTIQESLEGDWQMIYMESDNGTAMGESFSKGFRMKCRGHKLWLLSRGEVWSEEVYRLDSSRTPKAIDITYLRNGLKGQTMRGIYSLEGDTLTLCWGKVRPTNITRQGGNGQPVYVLKRIRASSPPGP